MGKMIVIENLISQSTTLGKAFFNMQAKILDELPCKVAYCWKIEDMLYMR